jgi:hypothetical protein
MYTLTASKTLMIYSESMISLDFKSYPQMMEMSMIKTILTCWMEKDPAKDPFMDNCIRAVCLGYFGWMAYHFARGLIG